MEDHNKISPLELFQAAFEPIHEDLEKLLPLLPEFIPCESRETQKMRDYLFSNPGKMIRPALFFLCSRLVGYEGPFKYQMAAVCEFVHSASLLHDDVVDNSTLRRNKPTMNSIWGDQSAVLFGDLVYARASELMAETKNFEVVRSFSKAIRLMSESELLQLENTFNLELSEETYMKVLFGKTAALIGASCKSPALLVGTSQETVEALEAFGSNLGIAFQLVDDALDFLSSDETLGKKVYTDLQEGRVTLPLILLKDLVSETEKELLISVYKQESLSLSDIKSLSTLVKDYRTAETTLKKAHDLTTEALSFLKFFPATKERESLESLALGLAKRTL